MLKTTAESNLFLWEEGVWEEKLRLGKQFPMPQNEPFPKRPNNTKQIHRLLFKFSSGF